MRNVLAALGFVALLTPAIACAQTLPPLGDPIEVQGPAGVLRGSLVTPASGEMAGVVLIIPGSGPTDRDGNNTMGIRAATYRLLAQALAEQDVASVRIDKRGMFGSAAPGLDPNAIVISDYAADIAAWTAAIRERTGVRCVWVAGHSEGALVAVVSAQTNRNDICGLILIAGGGRRLGDVLREQLRSNPANASILAEAESIITELEAGRRVPASQISAPLQGLFRENVQGFVISLFSYDPAELLRAYQGPVMVMQGTTDLQVTMQDAEVLAAARPVELVRLEGVNHVLKEAPMERGANLATYANPNLPLAPGIAERIAAFMADQGVPE
jgi:uncharacterized protein